MVFVLQKTGLTGFLQMWHQALGLQGERWKNGRNAPFFSQRNNECLPNFEIFNDNEFPETSNDLDNSEISLFIEQNRNVNTKKDKKQPQCLWKRWYESIRKQGPLKKFPPRNLTIFYVICLSKSGNGTHLFSGAVFNKCTIVGSQISPSLSLRRVVIDSDEDDWAWSAFALLTSCC